MVIEGVFDSDIPYFLRYLPMLSITRFRNDHKLYCEQQSCDLWLTINPDSTPHIRDAASADLIMTKTMTAKATVDAFLPDTPNLFTFHTSNDMSKSNRTRDYNKFIHYNRGSFRKNSRLLYETWCNHPEWPTLIFIIPGVADWTCGSFPLGAAAPKNIIVYSPKVTMKQLKDLVNMAGVFVCPSMYEGYSNPSSLLCQERDPLFLRTLTRAQVWALPE